MCVCVQCAFCSPHAYFCATPKVPHRFCGFAGVFCSADCQKQHFDALRFGSSAFKMKANETLVSQALELQ
jgi:hypothetical protein